MNPGRLNQICNCIEDAFQKVAFAVAELKVTRNDDLPNLDGKKYLVVVRLVGLNNGRIIFVMNEGLAQKVIEGMNGAPLDDHTDLYPYLAEFTNMVSGNGIMSVNNNFIGNDLRLTPPAIFIGDNLEITSFKVESTLRSYHTEYGVAQIEVGFEGR
jgi:CheY-specific phosphatase CheX